MDAIKYHIKEISNIREGYQPRAEDFIRTDNGKLITESKDVMTK